MWGKGKGDVGNELRLESNLSVLLIDPLSAMRDKWSKQLHEPKYGSGHGCRIIDWTRWQGLVLYIEDKGVNNAARPHGGRPAETGSLTASSLPLFLFGASLWTKVQNRLQSAVKSGPFISQCLPPDTAWHKVKSPKADYSGDLGEGKIRNEPKLETCWSMLLFGSLSAIWAWWVK